MEPYVYEWDEPMIEEPVIMEQPNKVPWIAVVAAVAVAAAAAAIIIRKKRKAKKNTEDEDEDI